MNTPIAYCVSCDPTPVCPPLDVVFVMDTSGSMTDEAAALCGDIAQVVADLDVLGITVHPNFLGISETPGGAFACLADDVLTMLGGEVPDDVRLRFPGRAFRLRIVGSGNRNCGGTVPVDRGSSAGDRSDQRRGALQRQPPGRLQ